MLALRQLTNSAINLVYLYVYDIVAFSLNRFVNLWSRNVESAQYDRRLNEMKRLLLEKRIFCKRPAKLLELLSQMTMEQLMIIVDFDATLTCLRDCSGELVPSCYKLISLHCDEELEPESRIQLKLEQIHEKYHKYEECSELDPIEKQKIMEEWWSISNATIIGAKLSEQQLNRIVDRNVHKMQIRSGVGKLFALAKQHNIPVHVYSGGFELIIRKALSSYIEQFNKTIFISANTFQYDENHVLSNFNEPLIFGEKYGFLLQQKLQVNTKWNKSDAIVVGDMIGDSVMADGISCLKNILKIGILNDYEKKVKADRNIREHYENNFDLVICDEDNINSVLTVIETISSMSNCN